MSKFDIAAELVNEIYDDLVTLPKDEVQTLLETRTGHSGWNVSRDDNQTRIHDPAGELCLVLGTVVL